MPKRPRHLYHFTCHLWWQFIQREGITRGECPLSATRVLHYPNLTANPGPSAQMWGAGSILDKAAIRVTVLVPHSDSALISWRDFARQHKVAGTWMMTLRNTGGDDKDWFVYRGKIDPSRFVAVDVLNPDVNDYEKDAIARSAHLTSDEARSLLMRPSNVIRVT